jgi:hypothetical protein
MASVPRPACSQKATQPPLSPRAYLAGCALPAVLPILLQDQSYTREGQVSRAAALALKVADAVLALMEPGPAPDDVVHLGMDLSRPRGA